ncbi:hypothetical protein EZJ19_06835, partial [Parasulfuritortus cantonensis]
MKPSQQQSGPEAGANITLATKAGQVESWLAALPLDDPLESARRLTGYLAAHDRAELPAGFRKQLLDLVSADVRRTLNVLERQFRHMALPMDEVEQAHVEGAVALLGAVADFAKHLLLESGERALHLFGGNPLPVYYSRFLHARLEAMDICHLSHRQLPEGFWLDCHRIGLRLLQSGLAETPDLVRTPASLRDLYLALLLEASADPYHLSAQERVWVTDLIARHGALATLEPPASARHSGVFGIRAHQDRPPFPLAWQRNVVPDCDLVLNTAPLVRKLALLISQVERGRAAPEDVPAIRHPGYRDLLQRLKLCWGASTQRTASRHRPAQRSQRTVLIGLPAVHGRLASADAPGDGAEPVACQILNDSSGGMALL